MKGKYINTLIMMAALSGKKTRRRYATKETIISLNDYKIIWSKTTKQIATKPAATI